MPDDFLDKEEALEHTAEAGGAAKSRVEELLERAIDTLEHQTEHLSHMATDLAELRLQRAAEQVPEAARTGVNDVVDTAGAAGDVAAKSIDVPLAASEDVIHDAGETAQTASEDVKKAKRLAFRKRR